MCIFKHLVSRGQRSDVVQKKFDSLLKGGFQIEKTSEIEIDVYINKAKLGNTFNQHFVELAPSLHREEVSRYMLCVNDSLLRFATDKNYVIFFSKIKDKKQWYLLSSG